MQQNRLLLLDWVQTHLCHVVESNLISPQTPLFITNQRASGPRSHHCVFLSLSSSVLVASEYFKYHSTAQSCRLPTWCKFKQKESRRTQRPRIKELHTYRQLPSAQARHYRWIKDKLLNVQSEFQQSDLMCSHRLQHQQLRYAIFDQLCKVSEELHLSWQYQKNIRSVTVLSYGPVIKAEGTPRKQARQLRRILFDLLFVFLHDYKLRS